MSIEQDVAALTTATTALLGAVNVGKAVLDEKVTETSASAAIALDGAATATSKATESAASAVLADAARDAAMATGKMYATTAAGLAAVASGAYFSVPSADSAESLILYENVAGAATERKRYPSTVAVAALGRAVAFTYDQPNLFTLEHINFSDLTKFTKSSVATTAVEVVNGFRTLKVNNGSITIDFPVSDFTETGKISSSFWVEKMIGGTSAARLRVTQLDAAAALLGYTESLLGTTDITTAKKFSVNAVSVLAGCQTVRFTAQVSASTGGDLWIRDLMIAQGSSSLYREPSVSSLQDSMIASKLILTESDLTVFPSGNLAKPEYLLDGKYINSGGTLSSVAGWKTFRIPVTPGGAYTFGNFAIDTAGYSSFLAADNSLIQYNGSYTTGTLPKTVTAPAGVSFLHVTVARPVNVPADYAQVIVNAGSVLLAYEAPEDTITEINGKKMSGSIDPSAYARLGFNANFAALTAGSLSVGALVANLPSGATLPGGVEVNQAWINTTDSTVRVRLA